MACKKIISTWAGMSLPNLVHSVRNYNAVKLQEFFDHFMKSTDDIDSLKVLHVILQLNSEQCLTEEVTIALTATLCNGTSSNAVKVLCSHILRASLPNKAIHAEDLQTCKETMLLICMLLLQKRDADKEAVAHFGSIILGAMKISEKNLENKFNACRILAHIADQKLLSLKPDESEALAQQLKQMLSFETQLPTSSSMKMFSQPPQVEDTSHYYVTVLSSNTANVKELHMNVVAFSVLRQLWPILFGKGKMSPGKVELKNTLVDYCLRVIEQTERVPLGASGENTIQQFALVESLILLDRISLDNEGQFVRVYSVIRRIYDQTTNVNVAVCALQIFLHQSLRTKYDPQPDFKKFFANCTSNWLSNQESSFEVVLFLKNNITVLNSMNPSPFRVWFPSILQIIAWHPQSFQDEFKEFVSTFMDPVTSIEVLHCLLDLPCLSAAMIGGRRDSSDATSSPSRRSPAQLKAMLDFLLRKESGNGETIDGLHMVYQELMEHVRHPRVVVAADCVVFLLQYYVEVIDEYGDEKLGEKLLQVILERSSIIYPVQGLQENVERRFSYAVLYLMKKYPRMVGSMKTEIIEFLSSAKQHSQELCLHLVWVIGQYNSLTIWPNCTMEVIRSYYDHLECTLYEHLSSTPHRMISVTVAAMVKLASRCQDLVPRVLIGLSKVIQYSRTLGSMEWMIIASRAEEFVAILGEPNMSKLTLSPPADSLTGKAHSDKHGLAVLWRAASGLMYRPSQPTPILLH